MVATPISVTQRYIEPGTVQWYWVATIANYHLPTRTELDAGKDLTNELAAVDGFTVTSNSVDAGDFGKRFTPKVDGLISADDSSMTFYRDAGSDDVRALLTRDLKGFIVNFPEGDDEGASELTVDIFPVSISSPSKQHTTSDPAQIQIQFTITAEPAVDVPVPTAA